MLATASQPEPSAKAPCTRTTFLICLVITVSLEVKDSVGRFMEMRHHGHDVLGAGFSYRSKRGKHLPLEAARELYELARIVQFARKIAATRDVSAGWPLFFGHQRVYPDPRPGQ
jgi:hypothetical protein